MDPMTNSLIQQLESLYADRELLHRELNVSEAKELIHMVRSMEAQLNDLYAALEQARSA
tara:strand:+ start:327 stop:503 length:177 start_codon:yes stop_codon:yes gene_type:complete